MLIVMCLANGRSLKAVCLSQGVWSVGDVGKQLAQRDALGDWTIFKKQFAHRNVFGVWEMLESSLLIVRCLAIGRSLKALCLS